MLHITTDCVFSGQGGKYNEDAKHDEMDVYGRTKSLGEPENCSVLRTSIIGEEFNRKSRCLLEWVKSSKDKKEKSSDNEQQKSSARIVDSDSDSELYLIHI